MDLKNSWLFPAIQSVHLVGLALFVGTIVIEDLDALGVAKPEAGGWRSIAKLALWTRIGLAIMLITGPTMFAADISRYLVNPAFQVKMALLAVALAFHFAFRRRIGNTRLAAVTSIAVWTCVVVAARAIADFDVY